MTIEGDLVRNSALVKYVTQLESGRFDSRMRETFAFAIPFLVSRELSRMIGPKPILGFLLVQNADKISALHPVVYPNRLSFSGMSEWQEKRLTFPPVLFSPQVLGGKNFSKFSSFDWERENESKVTIGGKDYQIFSQWEIVSNEGVLMIWDKDKRCGCSEGLVSFPRYPLVGSDATRTIPESLVPNFPVATVPSVDMANYEKVESLSKADGRRDLVNPMWAVRIARALAAGAELSLEEF